jgi:tetrahydromethanopterin S-methyltransferase subunit G
MKSVAVKIGKKFYSECDIVASAGVGFLIGTLYGSVIVLLLHKLTSVL